MEKRTDKILVIACLTMLMGNFFPLLAMGDKTACLFSSDFSMGVFSQLMALLILAAPVYVLWGTFKGFDNDRQYLLAHVVPLVVCLLFALFGKDNSDEKNFLLFPIVLSRGYWLCYAASLWIATLGLQKAAPQDPKICRIVQAVGAVIMVVSILFMPLVSTLSRRGFETIDFFDLFSEKAAGYTLIVLLLSVLVILAICVGVCSQREHSTPKIVTALPLICGTVVLLLFFFVLTMIAEEDRQYARIFLETGPYLYLLAAAAVWLVGQNTDKAKY